MCQHKKPTRGAERKHRRPKAHGTELAGHAKRTRAGGIAGSHLGKSKNDRARTLSSCGDAGELSGAVRMLCVKLYALDYSDLTQPSLLLLLQLDCLQMDYVDETWTENFGSSL